MVILVNNYISKVDRIRMIAVGSLRAAMSRDHGRHLVNKFRKAVTMKTALRISQRPAANDVKFYETEVRVIVHGRVYLNHSLKAAKMMYQRKCHRSNRRKDKER